MVESVSEQLKAIPMSIEAEQYVLGALFIDKEIIPDVLSIVKPDDFFREEHQEIMKAIIEVVSQNKPVDLLSVSDVLKAKGKLEFVGGISYMARLPEAIPNTVNAPYWAKQIKEKALLRKAMKYANEIEDLAAQGDLESVREKAQNITALQVAERDTPFSETFTKEDFEILSQSKRWFSKHFPQISKKVPFMRGEDIIIAGRTSTGKTQLALNLAMDFLEQGAKVGYVSMEMGKIQLLIRVLNWEYGMEHHSLLSDIDIRQKEWQEMAYAMFTQGKYRNLYLYEKSNDIADIVSWIRENRPDVVFIDYIQMVRSRESQHLGRNYEIGVVARTIRQEISKERCVVVMSQMNRLKLDEPDLSQIRDSGEIEQTATSVLFIDRPSVEADKWKFRIRVMKNQTLGAVSGWIDLHLRPNGEFEELTKEK